MAFGGKVGFGAQIAACPAFKLEKLPCLEEKWAFSHFRERSYD